jgi:hypothetical protein
VTSSERMVFFRRVTTKKLTCRGVLWCVKSTHLKNTRYAGPNDEYICTGSDSVATLGFERSSGAVSFLGLIHCDMQRYHSSSVVTNFVTYESVQRQKCGENWSC